MLYDFLDWVSYWVSRFGLTAVGWIARTAEWAGDFYLKAIWLYNTVWARIQFYTDFFNFNWLGAAIHLAQKLGEVFEYRYFWVEEIIHDLIFKLRQITVLWWWRFIEVFNEKWSLVWIWLNDWISYFNWLLANYKPRLHLVIVTDWLKVNWLLVERFVDLFDVFEPHVTGWRTFAQDPAQGIWDFVKPRLQRLVADYLVELW